MNENEFKPLTESQIKALQTLNLDEAEYRRIKKNLEKISFLMDDWIKVPLTDIRVGLDPILGLIPGLGDVFSVLTLFVFLRYSARLNIPPEVVKRIMLNVLIDYAAGSVPVVGDIFDAGFKSNKRNADLLIKYMENPDKTSLRSRFLTGGLYYGLMCIPVMFLALGLYLSYIFFAWLF